MGKVGLGWASHVRSSSHLFVPRLCSELWRALCNPFSLYLTSSLSLCEKLFSWGVREWRSLLWGRDSILYFGSSSCYSLKGLDCWSSYLIFAHFLFSYNRTSSYLPHKESHLHVHPLPLSVHLRPLEIVHRSLPGENNGYEGVKLPWISYMLSVNDGNCTHRHCLGCLLSLVIFSVYFAKVETNVTGSFPCRLRRPMLSLWA